MVKPAALKPVSAAPSTGPVSPKYGASVAKSATAAAAKPAATAAAAKPAAASAAKPAAVVAKPAASTTATSSKSPAAVANKNAAVVKPVAAEAPSAKKPAAAAAAMPTAAAAPAGAASAGKPSWEVNEGALAKATTTYSYDQLKDFKERAMQKFTNHLELDGGKLETYLSDADFASVFKCTRAEFYTQPKWKQTAKKKEAFLF